jgi:hypothetical protein
MFKSHSMKCQAPYNLAYWLEYTCCTSIAPIFIPSSPWHMLLSLMGALLPEDTSLFVDWSSFIHSFMILASKWPPLARPFWQTVQDRIRLSGPPLCFSSAFILDIFQLNHLTYGIADVFIHNCPLPLPQQAWHKVSSQTFFNPHAFLTKIFSTIFAGKGSEQFRRLNSVTLTVF